MDQIKTKDAIAENLPLTTVTTEPAVQEKKEDPLADVVLQKHLYDSLQRKQRIFNMLKKYGHMKQPEAAEITKQIKEALDDLEKIISG
jgi:hypothetical protein